MHIDKFANDIKPVITQTSDHCTLFVYLYITEVALQYTTARVHH